MTSIRFLLISLMLLPLVIATCVQADWINLTGAETAPNIAEIYVQDDHVRIILEIYIGDLKTFHDLVPDAWLTRQPDEAVMP